jgi:hypothetical protein
MSGDSATGQHTKTPDVVYSNVVLLRGNLRLKHQCIIVMIDIIVALTIYHILSLNYCNAADAAPAVSKNLDEAPAPAPALHANKINIRLDLLVF